VKNKIDKEKYCDTIYSNNYRQKALTRRSTYYSDEQRESGW
jgi:hypothetical protein